MEKILIVENNLTLSARLCYEIDAAGWIPTVVYSLSRALKLLKTESFSMIVAELELDDGNCLELCRAAKNVRPDFPVFLIVENMMLPRTERALLAALELGAVDFITKPFSFPVILKKLKMGLRRERSEKFRDDFLELDFLSFTASRNGKKLCLTFNEYRILRILTANRGKVVTRKMLLEQLWDWNGNFVDDHTLTVNMTRLRSKLEDEAHRYIRTVRGIGYLWLTREQA